MERPYEQLPAWEAQGLEPDRAALKPPPGINGPWLARQLKGRQTARTKIPAWYAEVRIEYPPSANLGQASSEATARYKTALLAGRAVADLCGGTGVDAWFIRQEAKRYLFNEPDASLLAIAQHNLGLGVGPDVVFTEKTAEAFSPEELTDYGALYLDPSRRQAGGGRAWTWAAMQPDLTRMPWLWSGQWTVLIKLSPGQDFTEVERHLPPGMQWHVLSVGNEVKELLALWQPGYAGPALRRIVELEGDGWSFMYEPEASVDKLPLQTAQPGQYLLEPAAGLLKAAAQDAYANAQGVAGKLHPNTHLYLAEAMPEDWFGRVYQIQERLPLEAAVLQGVGPCQISARNFGLEPEAILKKYKLKYGDRAHLYFVQDAGGFAALRILRIKIKNRE